LVAIRPAPMTGFYDKANLLGDQKYRNGVQVSDPVSVPRSDTVLAWSRYQGRFPSPAISRISKSTGISEAASAYSVWTESDFSRSALRLSCRWRTTVPEMSEKRFLSDSAT